MSPKRIEFDPPAVRTQLDSIRFPHICPICGKEANKTARISMQIGRKQYLRPQWDPLFYPSVRRIAGLRKPETKTLVLFVCEEHYRSDEGDTNYKLICLLVNAVLAIAFVFTGLFIANRLWTGNLVDFTSIILLLGLPVSLFITILAFRAGPLASSVRIIGFDAGISHIWLQFTNAGYRDAFIEENRMHAELVTWIVKS